MDIYLPATRQVSSVTSLDPQSSTYTVVVDDFVCMVIGGTLAEHLLNTLMKHYNVTIDREGKIFCGIHLKWDYEKRTVSLSIPNYVDKARA